MPILGLHEEPFYFQLVVDEAFIARALISLLERERLVADGAGVCAVAAVMQGLVPELRGKRYGRSRLHCTYIVSM